ncbi:MAG TPA: L-fucose mutarotase [Opitutaceae bacterium]
MLKGLPSLLSPDLLKVLREMGHGDEIVLADSNFPAASHAARLVRADGVDGASLLDAILQVLPLDRFVERPAVLMAVVAGDRYRPTIWPRYKALLRKHETAFADFELMERHAFYDRARRAYAIVATGETARYANLILKKGVIG